MTDLVISTEGYQELKSTFDKLERAEKLLNMMHIKYDYVDHHRHYEYQNAMDRYNEAQAHLKAVCRWLLNDQIYVLPTEAAG